MYITKENGEKEKFDFEIVKESLRNAGADESLVDDVIKRIENRIHDELTTAELKMMIIMVLRRINSQLPTDKSVGLPFVAKRRV